MQAHTEPGAPWGTGLSEEGTFNLLTALVPSGWQEAYASVSPLSVV